MSSFLTLGNCAGGGLPLRGKMRMFRVGDRTLSSYEYDTLDLSKLNPSATDTPEHFTVDEVERFFERTTDPRMTTGASRFAVMESDGDYTNCYFYRDSGDVFVNEIADGYRDFGAQTEEQQSTGLVLSLKQPGRNADAYFDNARFEVSNVLWEFSPDGGRGKWYKLYEMPNRSNTRITLPNATNQIKLRATSNNPEEWVQSVAISTKVDWQSALSSEFSWDDTSVTVDDFGYITWEAAEGGKGGTIYELVADGDVLVRTRNLGLAPDEYDIPAGAESVKLVAHDALTSIEADVNFS